MRHLTGGVDRVRVEGATVRQILNNLERIYPGFKERIVDAEEALQPGVAIAIGQELTILGVLTPVKESDEVHFIPAIGGGALAAPAIERWSGDVHQVSG
jgi:molybdopterin converting factor small subunit